MDENLDMEEHINDVCRRCHFYLHWINNIRTFISESDTKILVQTLVISRLDYCNSLLFGLPNSQISRLQSVMNTAARLIKLLPRRNHISPILKELHWLPIVHRINFKMLTFVFKSQHGSAPIYISDMLHPYEPSRSLRSTDQELLEVPKINNKYGTIGDN